MTMAIEKDVSPKSIDPSVGWDPQADEADVMYSDTQNKVQEKCENPSEDDAKEFKKKLSCLEWLTFKLKLVEDGATPPNWKYIGLVFVALFSSASTLTFLFPFLPEMVLTFGYSETEKGTYAGIIASAVFAGRVIGSVFWGWLADRYGRKIVLLITISFNGLFAGLFGFADNIVVAVIFRFLCGAVNGTVGTAKTILYDISDNTNQALSMSMLSISWGMGLIIGPTLGGLLASPAKKWPDAFDEQGLFGRFPYLLASLFPFVTCVLVFIIILFKFDETFVIKSKKRDCQEIIVDEIKDENNSTTKKESDLPYLNTSSHDLNLMTRLGQSMQSFHLDAESSAFQALEYTKVPELVSTVKSRSVPDVRYNHPGNLKATKSLFQLPIIAVKDEFKEKSDFKYDESSIQLKKRDENKEFLDSSQNKSNMEEIPGTEVDNLLLENKDGRNGQVTVSEGGDDDSVCNCVELACQLACCKPCRGSSIHRLLRLTDVWTTIMLYSVFSFTTIAVEDIFPVFASTTHEYGGLGFNTDEIGLAIGAMVLPLLVLQIKLYPWLVSKMGIRKVFLFSAMVSLITCQILPTVRLLHNHKVWLWICLIGFQIPFKIATNCCFAGSSLLINNSVTQDLAGQVNGLAMMTTAMGRTFAPIVAGSIFSWSVTYGLEIGAPFDTSFPFFVIGLLFFVTVFECLYLNPKLDQQKKRNT
ncbi:uncharacterized protein LOC131931076 [Physella acuta]|uniref:uncharacterized protein LOC131931076 n=1 Tax=Physella acuta TaxID=109671 RepID=UPI0027DE90F3|nr:uncharacterized protein LOC131931076 [Physella acuta]XP_059143752.1 uncharacterized protein LOC131931076 [Physella acuta]